MDYADETILWQGANKWRWTALNLSRGVVNVSQKFMDGDEKQLILVKNDI